MMGTPAEVIDHNRNVQLSLTQLARAFDIARDTVVRRLSAANVQPVGTARGFPVYPLRESAAALLEFEIRRDNPAKDPEEMSATDRRAWYQGEKDRLAIEREKGNLLSIDDHRAGLAELLKITVQVLDSLPDRLERECRLRPKAIELVERTIDKLREDLANAAAAAVEG